MKKVNVSFDDTFDSTGYLFSFAKCLSAAVRHSPYAEFAEDIVASSGFAFRMWVDATLCPSAMSIWEFGMQKPWVENGGLACGYVERLWGAEAVEEERRLAAVEIIKKSVDSGIAAVGWDISGCEWGLITGYDDESQTFSTLKINNEESTVPYEKLGKLDLPLLSVLTVTGKADNDKSAQQTVADTKKLAALHLQGYEWCKNAKGLEAYKTLVGFISEKYTPDASWNLDYYLGTYAALKWYAQKFFEKYGETQLAAFYETIYQAWKRAFDLKTSRDASDVKVKDEIIALLKLAYENEKAAAELMIKSVAP